MSSQLKDHDAKSKQSKAQQEDHKSQPAHESTDKNPNNTFITGQDHSATKKNASQSNLHNEGNCFGLNLNRN